MSSAPPPAPYLPQSAHHVQQQHNSGLHSLNHQNQPHPQANQSQHPHPVPAQPLHPQPQAAQGPPSHHLHGQAPPGPSAHHHPLYGTLQSGTPLGSGHPSGLSTLSAMGPPSNQRPGALNPAVAGPPLGPLETVSAAGPTQRVMELMELTRIELDAVLNDAHIARAQRDDLETRMHHQLSDMTAIQQHFYDLECAHARLKHIYDEEIRGLRAELARYRGAGDIPQSATNNSSNALPSGKRPLAPASVSAPTPLEMKAAHIEAGAVAASAQHRYQMQHPQNTYVQHQSGAPQHQLSPGVPHHNLLNQGYYPGSIPSGFPPQSRHGQQQIQSHSQQPSGQSAGEAMEVDNQPTSYHVSQPHGGELVPHSDNPAEKESYKRKIGSGWFAEYPEISEHSNILPTIDVELGHNLRHTSVVCCVQFSPGGEYVATGCNRSAIIWNVATGQRFATLRDPLEPGLSSKDDIGGTKQETGVVGSNESGVLYGEIGKDMPGSAGIGDLYIRSVSFSPDSRYVASGAEDRVIRLWNFMEEKVIKRFTGHEADIYALDFAPNGRSVISGSGDRTARIWDVHSGQCVHVLVQDDNTPVVCAGNAPMSSIRRARSEQSAQNANQSEDPNYDEDSRDAGVTSVAFSPCSRFVATGSLDTLARIYDVATGACLDVLDGHEDSVYSVSFRKDGRQLVTGSLDSTLRVWDLPDYAPAAVAAADRRNNTTSQQQFFRARHISTLAGHTDFVLSVAYAPDGNYIASGSKDRTVRIWDTRTGNTVITLQGHKNSVISVAMTAVSSNSTGFQNNAGQSGELLLATGSGDQRARIWRLPLLHDAMHHPPTQASSANNVVEGPMPNGPDRNAVAVRHDGSVPPVHAHGSRGPSTGPTGMSSQPQGSALA